MSPQHIAKEPGLAALALLKLTYASEDVFPPLKSAAGSVLHTAEIVAKFKRNQAAWNDFGRYVRDALVCVIGSLPEAKETQENLKRNVERLCDTLDDIRREIEGLQTKSLRKRIFSYKKDSEKILGMRQRLQDALRIFQLGLTLTTQPDVTEMLKGIDIQCHLGRVINKFSHEIGYASVTLRTLPYAEGASWDRSCVCLDNTRVALLEEIWNWINMTDVTSAPLAERIYWLTDVAGAGKSALAHTVAQRCSHQGILASSFFFDREAEGRKRPNLLFSTIARDLANVDTALAEQICLAIEDDRSLAVAPIYRQFEQLILKPSMRYCGDKPVVIIIDALDEGYSKDLLQVLRDDIPKLPRNFRIFLTSRFEDDIDSFLSEQSHIRCWMINIYGEANQADIASYVQSRLQYIATRKALGASWLSHELCRELTRRANGLFLWAFTATKYLLLSGDPENQLQLLLWENNRSNITAEERMNRLYTTILGNCNWKDSNFVTGYRLVMGAIIAVKTPLSVSALQSLHETLCVRDILGQFGSLLDGWTDENQAIRTIHFSLRDFVTIRAQSSPDTSQFYVSESEHNHRLALLCLLTLNHCFKQNIPGIGYLAAHATEIEGIPEISPDDISETFWYACRFWVDHVTAVEAPGFALINALRSFLSVQLVHWVEVVTSKHQFQQLHGVRKWLVETLPGEHDLIVAVSNPDLAMYLSKLSLRLSDLGQKEEALQIIEDAVQIYRRLAEEHPVEFNLDLVTSISTLSRCLSRLGRQEEALQTIKDAVGFYRRLAKQGPMALNANLAGCLSTLSHFLSRLNRREEALQPMENAVELYRRLAEDHPVTFNPNLAMSLGNLSLRLSDLGRAEESLQNAEAAVEFFRRLVDEHPAAFNVNLAISLSNLSLRLSHLGWREEALKTTEEAVQLYHVLAEERPAAFNLDLATSLSTLSQCLSDLGREEEALQTIEDAVELYRRLAEERPVAFNPYLARSLNKLSLRLSALGRREAALQTMTDSVELFRQLSRGRPATFIHDLAISLRNLSVCLSLLGRQEESLHIIEEAVDLHRRVAEERPTVCNPHLAESLNHLSHRLSDLGWREEALQAIDAAVELYRQLAEECPAEFNPPLACSLHHLSLCLSHLDRQVEAFQAIKEAARLPH